MATRLPTMRQPRFPQYGEVQGGQLDGWRFAFLRLLVQRRSVLLDLRVTPPAWPFPSPKPVRLNARTGFKRLRNPGELAPYLDGQQLIAAAVAAKGT